MIYAKKQVDVRGRLQGEKVVMDIDPNSRVHILSVLTNLYSDPELAIVREYSTNAADAHREVGQTRPIEVTTPTRFNPFLTIRDFGVGISAGDITRIYSQYGASTKRGSNDQQGMLGLGCKSALTYCDQFTVTSVKDGHRIAVAVSRDADGGGSMTTVDSAATDDPAGTTVVIPAKAANHIAAKAAYFFSHWAEGTVLLNGAPPERAEAQWVTSSIGIIDGFDSVVVMGSVAYPTREVDHGLAGKAIIAHVPIGSVDFAPSREALHLTPRTKGALTRIHSEFHTGIETAIQCDVDAAPTPWDAVQAMLEWRSILPTTMRAGGYFYKGRRLPDKFLSEQPPPVEDDDSPWRDLRFCVARRGSGAAKASHERMSQIDVSSALRTLWVTGYDQASYTATTRRKVDQWYAGCAEKYVFAPQEVDTYWIDTANVVPWETIKAVKLSRAPTLTGGRLRGSWDCYINSASMQRGVSLPQDAALFWQPPHSRHLSCARILAQFNPNFVLVIVPGNREAKFLRENTDAVHARDEVRRLFEEWEKAVDPDDALAMVAQKGSRGRYVDVDPSRLDDPALKETCRLVRKDVKAFSDAENIFHGLHYYEPTASFDDPFDQYPLLNVGNLWRPSSRDHVYCYLNAAYAAGLVQR